MEQFSGYWHGLHDTIVSYKFLKLNQNQNGKEIWNFLKESKCVNFCNRAGLEDPNQYYFIFQSLQSIKSFPRSSCICLNTFLSLRKKVGYTKWIHKMSFLCHSFWIVVYDSFLLSCTKLHYSKYNVFKSQVTNTKQNKKSTR